MTGSRRFSDTVDLLDRLIAYPTVSADSNLEMIEYLADRLGAAGASVQLQHDASGKKANLFGTLGPSESGGVLLSGHSDVVPVTDQPWSTDPFRMHGDDGKYFGRGSCDMKGFIAAVVAMAPDFARVATKRPIHFAFTYDEEVGCVGAGHLARFIEDSGVIPSIAIIGEPTEMRIIEGHKGCCEYTTRFTGLAGHGSSPDQGVNAVEYAVRYVNRLLQLKDDLRLKAPNDSRFEPPWTTVNVGALHGGQVPNVIASAAQVEWEMRPVQSSDADYVRDNLANYCEQTLLPAMKAVFPEASIETEVIGEVVGLLPVNDNEARRVLSELTGANQAGLVPFGTEAGMFQGLGMDVVVCGPGSIDQAHKADEFVSAEQLGQCLTMLERLALKLEHDA